MLVLLFYLDELWQHYHLRCPETLTVIAADPKGMTAEEFAQFYVHVRNLDPDLIGEEHEFEALQMELAKVSTAVRRRTCSEVRAADVVRG